MYSDIRIRKAEVDLLEAKIREANGGFPWEITGFNLGSINEPTVILAYRMSAEVTFIGQANGSDVSRVYGVSLEGDGVPSLLAKIKKLRSKGAI